MGFRVFGSVGEFGRPVLLRFVAAAILTSAKKNGEQQGSSEESNPAMSHEYITELGTVNIGVLLVRIGFGGRLFYNGHKEPVRIIKAPTLRALGLVQPTGLPSWSTHRVPMIVVSSAAS